VGLMAFFEWGVAFHDLDLDAIRKGEKATAELKTELLGIARKAARQIAKDYVAYPLLSGRKGFKSTLAANFTANILRNVWAHSIIFCGHFPDQTYTFSEAEVADENRGRFYVRQLLGAANIEGSPLFHILSGNLGYQVEHHLYPDMPSTRYSEPRSSVEVTRPGELWEPRSASRLCCSGPLTAPANRLSDEEPSPTEPRNAVAGVPAREGR
jgi:linoleoyl-CoA desaturase